MKIVSLVWFKIFPAKYGGQKGIALFEEHLGKHSEITCICSDDNEKDHCSSLTVLPIIPKGKWQFINVFTWIKILKAIKKEKADIFLLEHPYHALIAAMAKRIYKMKLVLHEHNIEFLRFKNIGKKWWPVLKLVERIASKQSDLIFYKTEQDRLQAIEFFGLNAAKTFVIPYGVESHEMNPSAKEMICQRHNIPADNKLILFAGTLDYEPNAKAVENIYKEIAPRLSKQNFRFTILICGRNKFQSFAYLNKLKHSSVLMIGEVDCIEDYFMAADVFINPVEEENGIQTKNLEALSYHLNLVCFENTLAGIDQKDLENKVFSVDHKNWDEFAAKTAKSCENNALTMVAFFENYSWESIAKKSANILCQLNKN